MAPRKLGVPSRRGHWKGGLPSFSVLSILFYPLMEVYLARLSIEDGTGVLVSWGGILFSVARNTMMQIGMGDMAGQGIKPMAYCQEWKSITKLERCLRFVT